MKPEFFCLKFYRFDIKNVNLSAQIIVQHSFVKSFRLWSVEMSRPSSPQGATNRFVDTIESAPYLFLRHLSPDIIQNWYMPVRQCTQFIAWSHYAGGQHQKQVLPSQTSFLCLQRVLLDIHTQQSARLSCVQTQIQHVFLLASWESSVIYIGFPWPWLTIEAWQWAPSGRRNIQSEYWLLLVPNFFLWISRSHNRFWPRQLGLNVRTSRWRSRSVLRWIQINIRQSVLCSSDSRLTFVIRPRIVISPAQQFLINPTKQSNGRVSQTIAECLRLSRLLHEIATAFFVEPFTTFQTCLLNRRQASYQVP